MLTDEMCVGPFLCRDREGSCCEIFFDNGNIICPVSCTDDTNRQSDVAQNQGFSIRDIFGTTLVTTLMFNVLTNIGAATTVSATTTEATITSTTASTITTTTTTTAPILTTSMFEISD